MNEIRMPRRYVHLVAAIIGLAAVLTRPALLGADTAAAAYQRALARETAARAQPTPSVPVLRAVAKSYEAIVRAHPTSGYADNALWQAAGLLQLAYQHGADSQDRDGAVRMLQWLKKEYPFSPFVRQVDSHLAALAAPAATHVATAAPANAKTAAPAPIKTTTSAVPPVAPKATMPRADGTASAASSAPAPAAPSGAASGAVPVTATPPGDSAATVQSIAHSPLPKGDRITIQLSRETTYVAARASNPDRILIDIVGASASQPTADEAAHLNGPLLKSLAVGKATSGATRFSLELTGLPRYSSFQLYNPFRLVIDIESDSPLPPAAAAVAPATVSRTGGASPSRPSASPGGSTLAPAPPPAPASMTRTGDYSLARQLGLGISRIVIDPGHGGYDPGAQANGISEAELVLDVSLRLETLLRARPGMDVVLTRRTNEFVPLAERTAIANREGADLFLSIHANASQRPAASGIETFFLNLATNAHAESVAARENATSAETMGTLPQILKTIELNNKLAESRELATMVQTSLVRHLAPQSKPTKDLGVKQAPFVVLIGAEMPSVLAEISFLTNHADAALLKESAYRQRIAQALCDSIVTYQASLKKVTTVAESAEGR